MSIKAVLVCAVILAGCASTSEVADTAVKTNLVQEQAHNQMLLLNVVRALNRSPMHFTQVSAVRLPPGFGNATFQLAAPFGGDRTHLYPFTSTFATQQSVDTAVLNSQEFMRGIVSPVPASLMLYYLDQGWPQQLVLHLFVRSVEFYADDPKTKRKTLVRRVTNYPENKAEFKRFQTLMEQLLPCELDSRPELTSQAFYTSLLSDSELKSVKDAAEAKAAGLIPMMIDANNKATSDEAEKVGTRFASETRSPGFELVDRPEDGKCNGMSITLPNSGSPQSFRTLAIGADGTVSDRPAVRLLLRSPEAMLYYLGEISRAQLLGQYKDADRTTELEPGFPVIKFRSPRAATGTQASATLFKLHRGMANAAPLKVAYEGETYSVGYAEDKREDRSMHVLSLLSQVLALQNKGTETPTTASVRVVP